MDTPPSAPSSPGKAPAATLDPAFESGAPDFADFAKFYDHYLPRVFAFALRGAADSAAAERLTEAILAEALLAGAPLKPGRAADAALLDAARRIGVRDEVRTNSRSSREKG